MLDEHSWRTFASTCNARLQQEYQEIAAITKSYRPFQCLGCALFGSVFLMPFLILSGLIDALRSSIGQYFFVMPMAAFGGIIICAVTGCKIAASAQRAQAQSQQIFDQASQQHSARNP